MSLKELSEAVKTETLKFGVKQVLKAVKDKKITGKIFVAKDAREDTINKLQKAGVNFEFSKTKAEISKSLELDFESEVFFIQ